MKKKILGVILVSLVNSFVYASNGVATESRVKKLEEQIKLLRREINALNQQGFRTKEDYLDAMTEVYAHGPAVVTSPSMGARHSAEDGSDLVINLSSINEDLVLLRLRKRMDRYAKEHRLPNIKRPVISISGGVVGKFTAHQKFGVGETLTDIDIASAEFSMVGEASPWATGSMIVSYDDDFKRPRFHLDRGFVTLGRLEEYPVYFSIGKMYAPFGSFSSHMLTDISAKKLGRVWDNMMILGLDYHGLNGQFFVFQGRQKSHGGNPFCKHAGANINYNFEFQKMRVTLGSSVIGNLAESKGIRSIFSDVKPKPTKEIYLNKSVPAFDGRIRLNYGRYTLVGEYLTALEYFAMEDLKMNDNQAKPRALNLEGVIDFTWMNSPNTIAFGYGRTWDALYFSLPEHTVFLEYNISLIKNTILGFEYRHDFNYSKHSLAKSDTIGREKGVAGGSQNIWTVKLGVYF